MDHKGWEIDEIKWSTNPPFDFPFPLDEPYRLSPYYNPPEKPKPKPKEPESDPHSWEDDYWDQETLEDMPALTWAQYTDRMKMEFGQTFNELQECSFPKRMSVPGCYPAVYIEPNGTDRIVDPHH